MVKSLLDTSVTYPEMKGIDPADEDYDAPVYEVEIKDTVVALALGKAKYSQVQKSIVYYPAYLLNKNDVVEQIGVYETLEENLPNIIDKDNDPDLLRMNNILAYSFVTEELLEENAAALAGDDVVGDAKTGLKKVSRLSDEDDGDEADEKKRKLFDATKADNWVQLFMHSLSYGIKDNEGGGDCFFASIRDGLSTIGKTVTVAELRNRISNAATPVQYKEYRDNYEELVKELKQSEAQIKRLVEEAKALKQSVANATNRSEKADLLLAATKLRDAHKEAKRERDRTKEVMTEFKWIAKLDTFPKFVKALRTCSFWADDWATSVLERLYNIKVILLSEEAYEEGDIDNILVCGRADDELMERKLFRPTEYIILVYTGNHYKLVTYDGKGAFTFNELPRALVKKIKTKCLERNAGLYSIIPEFMDGLVIAEEVVEDPGDLQLHGEATVFQFYDNAAVKPLPGKGTGELVGPEGTAAYTDLTGEWRRKLSHGFDKQFNLDGHMWKTITHYVEAQKFVKTNPEFYLQFTLESGSELSKDADMAKAAGAGKKYKGEAVRPKGTKADSEWNDEAESEALTKALEVKFADAELAALLKATKEAKLMLYRKGLPARVEIELMRVRRKLQT